MKHIATLTLLIVAGAGAVRAQDWPVKMTFSGTNVATTINLVTNTVTDEQHSAGNGTFGAFTFRELHADGASAQPPPGCAGPNYFAVYGGGGVLRFEDGSMIQVTVTSGTGCIDLAAGKSAISVKYRITGGTGRFEGVSGTLNYSATMVPTVRNAANAPAMLRITGEIEGTVSGLG